VFEFFHGEVPEGLVINHKDGDKTNNRISNLEAVTPYENAVHGRGTTLSQADVVAIRSSEEKQDTLAMMYGVSQATISDIKRRKTHNG
jgi:DNA-binding transcriptional regulator YiaG